RGEHGDGFDGGRGRPVEQQGVGAFDVVPVRLQFWAVLFWVWLVHRSVLSSASGRLRGQWLCWPRCCGWRPCPPPLKRRGAAVRGSPSRGVRAGSVGSSEAARRAAQKLSPVPLTVR